jgi:tetratricopeptide (TPR) repeat protein
MNKKQYRRLVEKAEELYLNGEYIDAESLYVEAFEYDIEVEHYVNYGFLLIEIEKLSEAEEVFTDLIALVRHPAVLFGLALLKSEFGKPQEALNLYEEIISMKAKSHEAYKNAADLYDDLGNKNKAIEYYLKSVELGGDAFWPYTNIGAIYESMDQNEKALEYFLKAYEINPKERIISYNLGVAYGKLKRYDEAIKYYLDDLDKDDHHELTYYNLGLAYKDGYQDYEKAKINYLLGLKENENNYFIWYNLGCVYALMEDYNNANDCFTYLKYKAPKIFVSIETDNELVEYRKTKQYLMIMG